MASVELIGGIAGGALSGGLAAWLTSRGQVRAMRVQVEGKLAEIERLRDHAVADRGADDIKRAREAEDVSRRALKLSASVLVQALRHPDVMNQNVVKAVAHVAEAASQAEGANLQVLAEDLMAAAEANDLSAVEAARRRLAA